MVKKVLSLIIAAVTLLSLVSCGGVKNVPFEEPWEMRVEQGKREGYLNVGDTYENGVWKITLHRAELAKAINLEGDEENTAAPADPEKADSENILVAEDGTTFLSVAYTVENLSSQNGNFHYGSPTFIMCDEREKSGRLEEIAYYLYQDNEYTDTEDVEQHEDAHKWYYEEATINLLLGIGEKETRVGYIELDEEFDDLDEEFILKVRVPRLGNIEGPAIVDGEWCEEIYFIINGK